MTSLSPTRFRSRSFLNDPPRSPDLPSGSILLNGSEGAFDSSTSSSQGHGYAASETDSVTSRTSSGTVSFAPLPVIPPELKRRSSITLGVAARKNLLSAPEDGIYPNPGKKRNTGGVQTVYMNDADWEEYKKHHEAKNGSEVVDIGAVVTNSAKNLWRRVKSQKISNEPLASPTTSTSSIQSGSTNAASSSSRTGSSPGPSGFMGLASPKSYVRRRSDPGAPPYVNTAATKSPDLPNVEEEALSRETSRVGPGPGPSSPTSPRYMDWESKPHHIAAGSGDVISEGGTGTGTPQRTHSPPPRVEDVLPSEDEVGERQQDGDEEGEGDEDIDEVSSRLERAEIQSEAGDIPVWKQQYYKSGRDNDVLGFDKRRFHGS